MSYCTNCGNQITTTANFCPQCGNSLSNNSVNSEIEYYLFEDTVSKKYGIKDSKGLVTSPAIFDEIGNVADKISHAVYGTSLLKSTDQISARMNKKWGFINYKGEWTIQPNFDYVGHYFYNDLCGVIQNEKIGYINETGEFIIQPLFDCNKNQLLDYLNSSDDDPWDEPTINNFDDYGYCIAQKNGKFGFIDKTGNWIIQPNYHSVTDFVISGNYDFSLVSLSHNRYGLIDRKNNWLVQPIYDDLSIQSSDLDKYGIISAELNGVSGKLWITNDKGIFFEENQITYDDDEEEDDVDDHKDNDDAVDVKNISQNTQNEINTSNAIAEWVNQVAIAVISLVILLGIVLFFKDPILSSLDSFLNGVEKFNKKASKIDFGMNDSTANDFEHSDNSENIKQINWIDGNTYTYDYVETIKQKSDDGTIKSFTVYKKNKPNITNYDCEELTCKWCGRNYSAEYFDMKETPNYKWVEDNAKLADEYTIEGLGQAIMGNLIGGYDNAKAGNKLYYDLDHFKIRTDWVIRCYYSNQNGFCSNKCDSEYNQRK